MIEMLQRSYNKDSESVYFFKTKDLKTLVQTVHNVCRFILRRASELMARDGEHGVSAQVTFS